MQKFNSRFNQIYVLYINNHELERAKSTLERLNINAKYFKGINGRNHVFDYRQYKAEYIKNGIDDPDKKFLTIGAYGHVSSFIKIMEDILEHQYKKVLILEPDVYFAKDFAARLDLTANLEYKIMYYGAFQHIFFDQETWSEIERTDKNMMNTCGYYYANKTLGTFAVALDLSIVEEYLNMLRTYDLTSDVQLTLLQNKYRTQCQVMYPNLICCDLTKSGTSVDRKHTEWLERLRWNLIEYDFVDERTFYVEPNVAYEMMLYVSSYLEPWSVEVYDEDGGLIYTHTGRTLDTHGVFASNSRTIKVRTQNVFVTKVGIMPKKDI